MGERLARRVPRRLRAVVGGLPYAQVVVGRAALGVAGVAALVVVATRLRPPRAQRAAALAVLAVLLVAGWDAARRPNDRLPPPRGLRITFLDVGQGDAR